MAPAASWEINSFLNKFMQLTSCGISATLNLNLDGKNYDDKPTDFIEVSWYHLLKYQAKERSPQGSDEVIVERKQGSIPKKDFGPPHLLNCANLNCAYQCFTMVTSIERLG